MLQGPEGREAPVDSAHRNGRAATARAVPRLRVRVAFALAAVLLPACHAGAQHLVVVASSDAPPYVQALAGIEKLGGFTIDVQQLGADAPGALPRIGRDTALVALGTRASEFVARAATGAPMVSCMVLSPDAARGAANAQVVPIEVPIEAQIEWLRTLLPEARSIGILFDPAINARRVEAVATALVGAGYAPRLAPVTSPAMLPQALANLPNAVDAILAIPDTTVYTPQASKALLLFSFRNKIPLIGLTEAWVRAGALYAVEWDYAELGAYCGMLALRALPGSKAAAPVPPRPRIAINRRSAEQLRVRWNTSLLRGIDRTYD